MNFIIKGKKKKAIGLIELLIVIVIGAIVVATVLRTVSSINEKNALTNETNNVPLYMNAIDRILVKQGETTAGLDNDFMITSGAIPKGVVFNEATGEIRNQFGGTIVFSDAGATSAISKDITYTQVPRRDICIDFVNNSKGFGFDEIEVDGNTLDLTTMSSADLTPACNSGTDTLTVVFTKN